MEHVQRLCTSSTKLMLASLLGTYLLSNSGSKFKISLLLSSSSVAAGGLDFSSPRVLTAYIASSKKRDKDLGHSTEE